MFDILTRPENDPRKRRSNPWRYVIVTLPDGETGMTREEAEAERDRRTKADRAFGRRMKGYQPCLIRPNLDPG